LGESLTQRPDADGARRPLELRQILKDGALKVLLEYSILRLQTSARVAEHVDAAMSLEEISKQRADPLFSSAKIQRIITWR
jgi:hypothetical protein